MTSYRQNHSIAWRELEGEAVLIHPIKGVVFVLNGMGSRIWGMLEDDLPAAEIVQRIAGEYQEKEERVEGDVSRFLNALAERELVEVI